jgi:peptidoglycan/LPS O-acetylase OafA/YrhL
LVIAHPVVGINACAWTILRLHEGLTPHFLDLVCCIVIAIGANQFLLFPIGFVAYVYRASLLRFTGRGTVICSATIALAACFCFYSLDEQWLGSVISSASRYTWLSPQPALFFRSQIAAILFLLAVIINPVIRDALSRPTLLSLGRLSFSLYLVHFPVLFTIGCDLFSTLTGQLPYGVAIVVTSIVVGSMTLIFSISFERLVGRRTVTWSKRLFKTA